MGWHHVHSLPHWPRMRPGPLSGHEGCRLVEASAGRALASLVLLAIVGLVAACQTSALPASSAPAGSRAVGAEPATARDRVAQALRDLGFSVRSTSDQSLTVVAERVGAPDPAWAECPLARAIDPNSDANRSSFERPDLLRTNVVARFATLAGATHVSLDVLQVGQYQNPFVALRFDERCRSAGGLEVRLLDAAAG